MSDIGVVWHGYVDFLLDCKNYDALQMIHGLEMFET